VDVDGGISVNHSIGFSTGRGTRFDYLLLVFQQPFSVSRSTTSTERYVPPLRDRERLERTCGKIVR